MAYEREFARIKRYVTTENAALFRKFFAAAEQQDGEGDELPVYVEKLKPSLARGPDREATDDASFLAWELIDSVAGTEYSALICRHAAEFIDRRYRYEDIDTKSRMRRYIEDYRLPVTRDTGKAIADEFAPD